MFSVRPCNTAVVSSVWYAGGETQSSLLFRGQDILQRVFLAFTSGLWLLETHFFPQLRDSYTLLHSTACLTFPTHTPLRRLCMLL